MTELLSMDESFIRKLTEIVLANLRDENFDVDKLTKEIGLSRATIHRKLRSIKGQDLSQFIREIRLNRAMELLQQHAGTASEIAFMVGFGSPAYFNKCFHECFGYPPGQVKKVGSRMSEEANPDKVINIDSYERGKWRSYVLSSAILLLIGIIIIGYVFFFKNSHSNNGNFVNNHEKSIAVLPFRNDSPNDSTTYFLNGVMEEITNNLQKINDFSRVLSRNSVEQFRNNTTKSTPEIAKKLNVNYIVEGSGQKYGNTFRVRVRIIDATSDRQIRADSYEQKIQETKDIFKIQNQIAQTVAEVLKATITSEEEDLIRKIPTTNLSAYDFYQRGREELSNYVMDNYNKGALIKAKDLFNISLKYDSTFAQAYIGLAKVFWEKHADITKAYYPENTVDSVLILCNKALSFDYKLAEAYSLRGDYYANKSVIDKAIDDYNKALKINPNAWEAYEGKGDLYSDDDPLKCIQNYQKAASLNRGSELPALLRNISYSYSSAGFIDKSKFYSLKAYDLDGDSVLYLNSIALSEKYQGNLEKAIELLKTGLSIDSTQYILTSQLGMCYMLLQESDESFKYYNKFIRILAVLRKLTPFDMHRIGWAYWENGYRKEAQSYFDKQIEYSKNQLKQIWGQKLYPYYDMAGVYAFRGDKKKAYDDLNNFNQRKSMPIWVVMFMKKDPLFNNIRNEPEFQKITKSIESKYQADHERVRKWLEENKML